MATENWQLTEDELQMVYRVYEMELLDEAGWARFYDRVRRACLLYTSPSPRDS